MVKLNLGCGDDIKKGYINIDLRATDPSVQIADIQNLPYKDNSVDEIYACDVLEHVIHTETKNILKHWYNILKPAGKLYIQAPCLPLLCVRALKAKTVGEKENALARIFAGTNYKENTHRTAIDPALIRIYLKRAGFEKEPDIQMGNFGNGTNIRVTIYK